MKPTLPAKAVRWISRALTLDASQRPNAETLLRDSFMEDIYKQFEDRWNAQTAAVRATHQRVLSRVGSGGGGGAHGTTNNTDCSPSRSDKLPELHSIRSSQQQQPQQTLMATSSENLAMAAKFFGNERLPEILNHNKAVM